MNHLPSVLFVLIMVASILVDNSTEALSSGKLAGILFDIDGTLIHSDPIHLKVFQELLLQEKGFNNNLPIDEAFFRKHIAGRQNALIMQDFFPEWSLERREAWSVQKEARFRELAVSEMMDRKMPGLDALRQFIEANQIPRAAVTNAPRLNAEAMIGGIDYDDNFFQTLIIGDECEKPKPDPCPYLTACKHLNLDCTQCIVFEDSPSGARAGVAAGAFVIGILSGQEEQTLLEAGCSMVIKDYTDTKLWDYLELRTKI